MKTIVVGNKFESKFDFRETCFGIVENNSKLLLVKKNNQYSFVGGGIENGETFEQCLKREFLEESGYNIVEIKDLVCIDCFWLAADKYPMESKANIFEVKVDLLNPNSPLEEGCKIEWINILDVNKLLPLPYHKAALEYYLSKNKKDS